MRKLVFVVVASAVVLGSSLTAGAAPDRTDRISSAARRVANDAPGRRSDGPRARDGCHARTGRPVPRVLRGACPTGRRRTPLRTPEVASTPSSGCALHPARARRVADDRSAHRLRLRRLLARDRHPRLPDGMARRVPEGHQLHVARPGADRLCSDGAGCARRDDTTVRVVGSEHAVESARRRLHTRQGVVRREMPHGRRPAPTAVRHELRGARNRRRAGPDRADHPGDVQRGSIPIASLVGSPAPCGCGDAGRRSTTIPLRFDPRIPLPPPPTLTATPTLVGGSAGRVHVHGERFVPGAQVAVSQCWDPDGRCGFFARVHADTSGRVDVDADTTRFSPVVFFSPVQDCALTRAAYIRAAEEIDASGGGRSVQTSLRFARDPNLPTLRLGDAVASEGDTSNQQMKVAATIDHPVDHEVGFGWYGTGGYGLVFFPAGSTRAEMTFSWVGDTVAGSDRTLDGYLLILSGLQFDPRHAVAHVRGSRRRLKLRRRPDEPWSRGRSRRSRDSAR